MPRTFDLFLRAGASPRRRFIRTVEDACPYRENTWFAHTYPQYALSVTTSRATSPGVRGFKTAYLTPKSVNRRNVARICNYQKKR